MTSLVPEFHSVSELLEENLQVLSEGLSHCLGTKGNLISSPPQGFSDQLLSDSLQGTSGIFLAFRCGDDGGYLLAIPENLPLPAWYRSPNEIQQAKLKNLAENWMSHLFPDSTEPIGAGHLGSDHREASAVQAHDLVTAIRWAGPTPDAQIQELRILPETADPQSKLSEGVLWLIGPIEIPPSAQVMEGLESEVSDSRDKLRAEQQEQQSQAQAAVDRVRRLMPLTVTVSVRLAEMKIELSSLVNLCPGTLLVFPKSCDDLLDLYVNNQLYAQGEAVKIGEKFGLKVNQVGVQKQRKSGVFSL